MAGFGEDRIREHVENGRVLIITDRTELDEQIEKVFGGVDERIYRAGSGADLVNVLNAGEEWLICSLIHKFGASEDGDIDTYLRVQRWYRQMLREQIPDLLARWEPIVGVQVASCGIKRMKTRWGTCNIETKRIWLNLELAKKPPACLEYILVHELVHLRERNHNDRFRSFMDEFMPQWRMYRAELNRAPLAHEDWFY